MTPQDPRGPQASQPEEPGWWQASDGLWYPPESAAGASPAPPAPTVAPEPTSSTVASDGPPPSTFASATAPVEQSNGLAVTSLVFGFVGFCLCGIGGVIAIITGLLALKKPRGRGMAVAGIILGVVSMLATVGLVISLIVGGNWTVNWFDKTVKKTIGVASPNDYRIRGLSCSADNGAVTATGTIENRTSGTRNFIVVIIVRDPDTGTSSEALTPPVTDIPAGESREFTTTATDLGPDVREPRCSVREVRNFLN